MDRKCETCEFWDRKIYEQGQCRRFPVSALTGPEHWCGEWREGEVRKDAGDRPETY